MHNTDIFIRRIIDKTTLITRSKERETSIKCWHFVPHNFIFLVGSSPQNGRSPQHGRTCYNSSYATGIDFNIIITINDVDNIAYMIIIRRDKVNVSVTYSSWHLVTEPEKYHINHC